MPCFSPKVIVNPHYLKLASIPVNTRYENKLFAYRLYGSRPDFYLTVPCGRCRSCLSKRASDWTFRLAAEHDACIKAGFQPITLDLDVAPQYYNDMCRSPSTYIRRFFDLVRKKVGYSVRYMLISEYGKKNARWHLHGMLFNVKLSDSAIILNCWKYGRSLSKVIYSYGSYEYRTKYIFKDFFDGNRQVFRKKYLPTEYAARPGRVWCSPGIGRAYIDDPEVQSNFRRRAYITAICLDYKGRSRYLPRYLRDKLFTEEEQYALKQAFLIDSSGHPFRSGYVLGNQQYASLSRMYDMRNTLSLPVYPIKSEYIDTAPDFLYEHFRYFVGDDQAQNLINHLLNYGKQN